MKSLINRSREEFRDHFLLLLHILIQRITSWSQSSDLVKKIGQLNRWQGDYFLTEWIMVVDSFYSVLDEQIQQFLELHSQTQPQVIIQVYSQLHRLSREVNRGSITHIDQVRQTGSDEQIQTLRAALHSLQQLSTQRVNYLQQVTHDLRSSLSIISSAASLLQGPLKGDDLTKYMDMLNRNVKSVGYLLDHLVAHAQSKEDGDA